MSRYTIGDPTTREPHPDAPPEGFPNATAAVTWAMARDLPAQWWPLPSVVDAQPSRMEGVQ